MFLRIIITDFNSHIKTLSPTQIPGCNQPYFPDSTSAKFPCAPPTCPEIYKENNTNLLLSSVALIRGTGP